MLGLLNFFKKPSQAPLAELDLTDMQGILLSGYGHLTRSRFLFLNIQDAAAAKAGFNRC